MYLESEPVAAVHGQLCPSYAAPEQEEASGMVRSGRKWHSVNTLIVASSYVALGVSQPRAYEFGLSIYKTWFILEVLFARIPDFALRQGLVAEIFNCTDLQIIHLSMILHFGYSQLPPPLGVSQHRKVVNRVFVSDGF